jgi:hypothetical protein
LLATLPQSGCSLFEVEVGSSTVGRLPVSTTMPPSL